MKRIFLLQIYLLILCQYCKCQILKCPAGCFCDRRKGENLPPKQDGLRIHCVLMENEAFSPGSLPNTTLQLDLSKNDLKAITKNFFSNVKYLEKVDLSSNSIKILEDGAFRNLAYLKSLDLSKNKLTVITTETLLGLSRLEKLKLSSNFISTIEYGSFQSLASIQKIDLADNPLACDCHMAWLKDWMDVAGTRARCGSPPSYEDFLIKKLSIEELTCDVPIMPDIARNKAISNFKMVPAKPQIVFEGDSLQFQCYVGTMTANEILVRWYLNANLVTRRDASVTNLQVEKQIPDRENPQNVLEHGQQSDLYIHSLKMEHHGNWTCSALVDTGEVHNETLSIVVINHATILCPSSVTNTSKGYYHWGVTLAGQVAMNKCQKPNVDVGKDTHVVYTCDRSGQWKQINDSQCSHISDVTDKLYRFAYMNNTDFDENTLVQSARKLLEFTGQEEKFQDGMDIVYLSTVLENYIPYLKASNDLGGLLVDIAANIMRMSPNVISQGQLLGHAATRLMVTIANISRIVPAFQHQKNSLAVETKKVSPRSFAGVTCTWYKERNEDELRLFYCSENNKTVGSQGRSILGSVQLPSTLYYQLELLDRDVNNAKNLLFTAFQNGTLFPLVSLGRDIASEHQSEQDIISSCILGSSVVALEPFNLSEPVYVILELKPGSKKPQPAWWDNRANNGLGAWQTDYCRMMKARRQSAVFSCHRLGFYAIIGELPTSKPKRIRAGIHNISHPAVYGGTIVAVICLTGTTMIYCLAFPFIGMSKKMKHALPNFWMSLICLLVFYTISGAVTVEEKLCQIIGLLVHYFCLTSSLWVTICLSIVHRKLVNPFDRMRVRQSNPYVINPEEEVYIGIGENGKRLKKPIARFYLVGWGVPLIICGITGGASIAQYSISGWCFLSPAPAAGAVIVPILISFIINIFFIITIFTFSPEKNNPEHMQRDFIIASHHVSQNSLSSKSTIHVTDLENTHRSHALSLISISVLLLGVMFSAAMTTSTPIPELDAETQADIFSTMYAVLSSTLGLVVMTYYCLLRQDVLLYLLPAIWDNIRKEDTSNLVDLASEKKLPKVTKSTNLPPYNSFQTIKLENATDQGGSNSFQLKDLGGSVLGPSSARIKQCNIVRGVGVGGADSETLSSDYHSINNAAHLRRPATNVFVGHVPPINSRGYSDAETANKNMTDIILGQGSKSKVNNINIHVNETVNKVPWLDNCEWVDNYNGKLGYPSPSPSSFYNHQIGGEKGQTSLDYSPIELPCPDLSLESSHLLMTDRTGESAIGLDSWSVNQKKDDRFFTRDPFPISASLPRRTGRNSKARERSRSKRDDSSTRQLLTGYSDVDRMEVSSNSKFSEVSFSTVHSTRSKGSSGRTKRNKPRRKPRKRSEVLPIYSGKNRHHHPEYLTTNQEDEGEEEKIPQKCASHLKNIQDEELLIEKSSGSTKEIKMRSELNLHEHLHPSSSHLKSPSSSSCVSAPGQENLPSPGTDSDFPLASHISNIELHNKETCV